MNCRIIKILISISLVVLFSANKITRCEESAIELRDKTPLIFDITNDKRQYIRIKHSQISAPITISSNGKSLNVIDISRGGLKLANTNYNIDEEIPINIKYKNIEIKTAAKVIRSKKDHLGLEFTRQEDDIENKLLYLSIMLESDSGLLKTRFSENGVL